MPNYAVELTEGEISTILYHLEAVTTDYKDCTCHRCVKSEFTGEMKSIFIKLEGAVDTYYEEKENA